MEHNELQGQELEELERKLRLALRHRKAPAGLKNRVLTLASERRRQRHGRGWMLQRVAASILLAAMAGGFVAYRQVEERRKGEAAREQVMTALRITNKTLSRVSDRVSERLSDDR